MPYVNRNEEGKIIAAFANEQFDGQEALADDDADLASFLALFTPPKKSLSVSRLRMKLTLKDLGHLAAVEAVVAAAGETAQMYWAEATEFERDHPMVVQLGAAAGLTPQVIDEIFTNAATRNA